MPVEEKKKGRSKWKWLLLFIILVVAVFAIFYFFVRIYHVNTGYIGVRAGIENPIDPGAAYDINLVNGYVVYVPLLTTLEVYPTTVFSYDLGSTKAYTRDGISLDFAPKVLLKLDETKADLYYRNFKNTDLAKNEHLVEVVRNVFMNQTSMFDTDSLIRNKVSFEQQLEKELSEKLAQYAIMVKNVNSNLEYPQEIKNRVELNVKTEQEIYVAQTEARLAYIKAESKRQQDSLQYSTLSKLSIQKLFIDKWDGRLAPNPEQPIMYGDINSNDSSSELPVVSNKEKVETKASIAKTTKDTALVKKTGIKPLIQDSI